MKTMHGRRQLLRLKNISDNDDDDDDDDGQIRSNTSSRDSAALSVFGVMTALLVTFGTEPRGPLT